MGTMVRIDDALLARAAEAVGATDAEAIIDEALRALIARENARAIIALGGSDPDAWVPERRRPPSE